MSSPAQQKVLHSSALQANAHEFASGTCDVAVPAAEGRMPPITYYKARIA